MIPIEKHALTAGQMVPYSETAHVNERSANRETGSALVSAAVGDEALRIAANFNWRKRSPATASLWSLNRGSSLTEPYAHTGAYRKLAA
jgi:hypothetical protein